MDTNGTIYPLTVTFEHLPIPLLSMNLRGIRIQGSMIASRQCLRELLEFASQKHITPTIMKFPLSKEGIDEVLQKLRDGEIRYKAVLEHDLSSQD